MPRKIACWLAFGVAAGALVRVGWPGASADPATLISRVSVIIVVLMLAGLPRPVRTRFGPIGDGWVPRVVRVTGYAAVFALMLVETHVGRFQFDGPAARPSLAGLWAGEVVFLIVLGAYVAGLLAVTSRRPPTRTTTLAIGAGAGVVIGVAVYGLRPLADQLHVANPWLGALYEIGKVLAVPAVLCAVLAAGVAAARRASNPGSRLRLTDLRARQGFAAGACVGVAAALVVSVLGIATIAVAPHVASGVQWTLPGRGIRPGSGIYFVEVSITQAAAGYLLVLVLFPLLGAGLGAWGGLFAAGNSGLRPDDGGGGGPKDPDPVPVPPGGGREATPEPRPAALDLAALLALPPWDGRAEPVGDPSPVPRVPSGVP
jgi:hypothetical protein